MNDPEKTCPHCAETIKAAAVVCKHCGRDLIPPVAVAAPQAAQAERKTKWWLWIPLGAAALFMLVGLIGSNSPEAQAKIQDRRIYEQCVSDMRDELRSRDSREASRFMCERLRDDFVRKYGREP